MMSRAADIRWELGRPTAGDDTFSYCDTPGGFVIEYTAEVGVGGPQSMLQPIENPGLFNAAEA